MFPVWLGKYVLLGCACWWANEQRMTTNFQLNAPSTGSQQGGGGSHQPGLLKTPGWYDSIIGHWTAFSWGKKNPRSTRNLRRYWSRETYGTMAIAERCDSTGLSKRSRLAVGWIDVLPTNQPLVDAMYSSSHDHGSGEWVPTRLVSSTIGSCSTSMIMGGRVGVNDRPIFFYFPHMNCWTCFCDETVVIIPHWKFKHADPYNDVLFKVVALKYVYVGYL